MGPWPVSCRLRDAQREPDKERLQEVTVNVQVNGMGQVPVRRLAGIDLPARCTRKRAWSWPALRCRVAPRSSRKTPPSFQLHLRVAPRGVRHGLAPRRRGHLRIEMRALPAGPTVTDMLANAAFLIGLTLWLAGRDERWTYALPFERADHGFYRTARPHLDLAGHPPLQPGARLGRARIGGLEPQLG